MVILLDGNFSLLPELLIIFKNVSWSSDWEAPWFVLTWNHMQQLIVEFHLQVSKKVDASSFLTHQNLWWAVGLTQQSKLPMTTQESKVFCCYPTLPAGTLLYLDVCCQPSVSSCMTCHTGGACRFRKLVFIILQPVLIGHSLHLPGLSQLGKCTASCG